MAAERDLARTRMRGLALAMVLEHRAGDAGRAKAHLAAYLRLYAEAEYARPLARERTVALALLDEIAGDPETDAAIAGAAAGLREAMGEDAGAVEEPLNGSLNGREMDVLALLEGHTDRDIAEALKLSYEGVRSRIRGIFAKLGARSRLEAVHHARARGLLPPAGGAARSEP